MRFDLVDVVDRLRTAGCVAAEEEAIELVSLARDGTALEASIRRRELGEPLAWITGGLQFLGHRIRVEPGVYVPRIQSEELALRAASLLAEQGGRAADLCTGAGAIAFHLTVKVPSASVIGTDLDIDAVRCARSNGVRAIVGDLGEPLRSHAFDVVTAIAPYVPSPELRMLPADVQRYEPRLALDGGEDGLDLVRRVVVSSVRLLRPGGWLLVELGGSQDDELSATLTEYGFGRAHTWVDEDGDLRGLACQAPPAIE